MNRKALISWFISLAVALTTVGSVAAQEPPPAVTVAAAALSGTPVGTAITYQGQLKQNGNPANGNFDFQFILYDAARGGNQQGVTLQLTNVAVNNGVFNVQLDFGQTVFNGDARFLEVRVKPVGSTETYTVLSPRTTLGAVPYALGMPGVMAQNGNVGIGTTLPKSRLTVNSSNAGSGVQDWIAGNYGGTTGDRVVMGLLYGKATIGGHNGDLNAWSDLILNTEGGNVGIGTANPQAKLEVVGTTRSSVLQITGGSDLAELFSQADGTLVEPGTVMVIDPEHAGKLKISTSAYDRKVVGIVSGAGDINPGLTLQQEGVLDGNLQVAIAGRVYVKAEANSGTIEPGDLLTTSGMAGYAMKATNDELSHGAVIGKAMTGLQDGTGLVLVLVNLQ